MKIIRFFGVVLILSVAAIVIFQKNKVVIDKLIKFSKKEMKEYVKACPLQEHNFIKNLRCDVNLISRNN